MRTIGVLILLASAASAQFAGESLLDDDLHAYLEDPARRTKPIAKTEQDEKQKRKERWSSFLPIGGRKVKELGYELPLPFGISSSLFLVKRKFDIKELSVGIDGGDLKPVPEFIDISVSGEIVNLMARFDAWILPFWNVYVMAGYQGKLGRNVHGAFWVAYYYWDTETDVEGSVNAPDGTEIRYRVRQGPEVPWNLAIGGRLEFSETSSVVAEWGFNNGVTIFLLSGTFRF